MSPTSTNLNEIKECAQRQKWQTQQSKKCWKRKVGGIFRIDFPGYSGEDTLEEITWDEWYKIFKSESWNFLPG